jgi:hypothetical protein
MKREYPRFALCQICQKLRKQNRIRFIYNNIVASSSSLGTDPNPDNLDQFCRKLIKDNFAVVKGCFYDSKFRL